MDQQSEHAFSTGEIFEPEVEEGFEGRYDRGELHSLLLEVYALRQACIAEGHKQGELAYNPAVNVLTCKRCLEQMDLNAMVDENLRVRESVPNRMRGAA